MLFNLKKITIIIAAAMFFVLPALAYYNPGNPTGFVNDFANVLTSEQKSSLEQKLIQFERETSNEIAVAIIPSLQEDTIEKFADGLFTDWGIGKKNKDNGVLVLIAIEDRQIRIEPGYGLEGALTDAQSSWIIKNDMSPAFKEGKYYAGIDAAVDKIIAATQGEYVPSDNNSRQNSLDLGAIIFNVLPFGFVIFVWLASILGRSKSWWAGGIVGAVIALIITIFLGFILWGLFVLVPLGLLFDFLVSRKYQSVKKAGGHMPWWIGGPSRFGGGHGGGFGGFGGFGGGSSGGGGASGRW